MASHVLNLDEGEWSASHLGPFNLKEWAPGTDRIRSWVGTTDGLDALESRKISWSCLESNSHFAVFQPVAQPPYLLSCPGSIREVNWILLTCRRHSGERAGLAGTRMTADCDHTSEFISWQSAPRGRNDSTKRENKHIYHQQDKQ